MEIILRKDNTETTILILSDLDVKIVEHSIDFLTWLEPSEGSGAIKVITDKVEFSRKRLLFEAVAFLRAHNLEIPASTTDIFNAFFSHPEYKTKDQQEEVARLARLAEEQRIIQEKEAARLADEEAQRISEEEEMQQRITEAVAAAVQALASGGNVEATP